MRYDTCHWALCCVLMAVMAPPARANLEPFWDAKEFHTRSGHLRYLLLVPPDYDPHRMYELWVNLHGNPGCASHAIYQYRQEARERGVFLLAPEATDPRGDAYTRPDATEGRYCFWRMRLDPQRVLTTIGEVVATYPIDRSRITLLGFSAGCEMGWRLLSIRPNMFCFFGGVGNGFRGGRAPISESGLRRAAKHTPHFYAVGQADPFAGPMYKRTVRKLHQYGFELRTEHPAAVGHELPPSIKTPLLAFLDEVRARTRGTSGQRSHLPNPPVSVRHSKGTIVLAVAFGLVVAALLLFRSAHRRPLRL